MPIREGMAVKPHGLDSVATPRPRGPSRQRALELLDDLDGADAALAEREALLPVSESPVDGDPDPRAIAAAAGGAYAERFTVSDRLASLGILAAGLSHQVLNPLAVIAANADLIPKLVEGARRRPDDADALEALFSELVTMAEEITQSTGRIRATVAGMRRIGGCPQRVAMGPVPLRPIIEHAIGHLDSDLAIRATIEIDVADDQTVMASTSHLTEIIHQLVRNALESFPEPRQGQRVRIELQPTVPGRAILAITDNGAGIPVELAEQVFEPYVTSKDAQRHVGMGLTLARHFADGMGGEVALGARSGGGTVASVLLWTHE